MFNIGDLVIYSTHGVCKIDDISEKTIAGVTRKYYELHPVDDEHQLTISAPAGDDRVTILELMDSAEANDVLESFKNPSSKKVSHHPNSYTKLVDSGDRKEIADIINALLRKKWEMKQDNKKLNGRDQDLLDTAREGLFKELAISLDSSKEQINDTVVSMIKQEKIS